MGRILNFGNDVKKPSNCYWIVRGLYINRSSWRKRSVASTPLFIIPGFFLHFSLELSYGYLRFEGNGEIPLGRQGKRSLKGRAFGRKGLGVHPNFHNTRFFFAFSMRT